MFSSIKILKKRNQRFQLQWTACSISSGKKYWVSDPSWDKKSTIKLEISMKAICILQPDVAFCWSVRDKPQDNSWKLKWFNNDTAIKKMMRLCNLWLQDFSLYNICSPVFGMFELVNVGDSFWRLTSLIHVHLFHLTNIRCEVAYLAYTP